jgi:hypothetical protein
MSYSIRYSGAAFVGNEIINFRPLSSIPNRQVTNYVSLTQFCANNFITKRTGRTLIQKRLLIGQRFKGQWWVCSNPFCYQELLNYLGVEALLFDAVN